MTSVLEAGTHDAQSLAAMRTSERVQGKGCEDRSATQRISHDTKRAPAFEHDHGIAHPVVQRVSRRGLPSGRGRYAMPGMSGGCQHDFEASVAHAQRPVDVLDVGEQLLVEKPNR